MYTIEQEWTTFLFDNVKFVKKVHQMRGENNCTEGDLLLTTRRAKAQLTEDYQIGGIFPELTK